MMMTNSSSMGEQPSSPLSLNASPLSTMTSLTGASTSFDDDYQDYTTTDYEDDEDFDEEEDEDEDEDDDEEDEDEDDLEEEEEDEDDFEEEYEDHTDYDEAETTDFDETDFDDGTATTDEMTNPTVRRRRRQQLQQQSTIDEEEQEEETLISPVRRRRQQRERDRRAPTPDTLTSTLTSETYEDSPATKNISKNSKENKQMTTMNLFGKETGKASTSDDDGDDEAELTAALAGATSEATKEVDGAAPRSTGIDAADPNASIDETNATANSNNKMNLTATAESLQVDYAQGATPLFMACEETRWSDALELLEGNQGSQNGSEHNVYSRTWVQSSGAHKHTTFGWSVWRRLPLHEACRKQAPAWLVAALVRDHPESVRQATHFGSLPIHLAVEMGASPEVVNLLLVSYWEGIIHRDNSGRTPLDILRQSGDDDGQAQWYDPEAREVVEEALSRCQSAYLTNQRNWENKVKAIHVVHEKRVEEINNKHKEEVEEQARKYATLQQTLKQLCFHIENHKAEKEGWQKTLMNHTTVQSGLIREMETRDIVIARLEKDCEQREEELTDAMEVISDQSEEITRLKERMFLLESDLQNLYQFQQVDILQDALEKARIDLRLMIESQQALEGMLTGQARGMRMILDTREIPLPEPPVSAQSTTEEDGIERQLQKELGEAVDVEEVTKAAATAASRALQLQEEAHRKKAKRRAGAETKANSMANKGEFEDKKRTLAQEELDRYTSRNEVEEESTEHDFDSGCKEIEQVEENTEDLFEVVNAISNGEGEVGLDASELARRRELKLVDCQLEWD